MVIDVEHGATLRLGNLASGAVAGTKLKLEWKKKPATLADGADSAATVRFADDLDKWAKTNPSKRTKILTPLRPGTWTTAKVVIPSVPPAKLDWLSVGITFDQVSLTKISSRRDMPARRVLWERR